tara:strand:+ start:345 stop:494 length:150 start_codon:yes stop_codon:yes gene_type:complete
MIHVLAALIWFTVLVGEFLKLKWAIPVILGKPLPFKLIVATSGPSKKVV